MTKKVLKVAAVVADLTNYLTECETFEKGKVIKEKHVSTQVVQVPNFAESFTKSIAIPGVQQDFITTIYISVLYVHEVEEKTN